MTRIVTKTMGTHVGHVVGMDDDKPCSLIGVTGRLVAAAATGGLSEIFLPDHHTIARDDLDEC